MRYSKAVTLAGTFFLICTLSLFAQQDRATPPPTRMGVPSDSIQTAPPESPGQASSSRPQMELPEVLIQGENRRTYIATNKESVVHETPVLLKPDAPSQVISTWFQLQESKPPIETASPDVLRSVWGEIQGGSNATFLGNLGYWQEFGQVSFHGQGWFDRTDGQYLNSQYTNGGGDIKLDYRATENFVGTVTGGYEHSNRGMHGAALADVSRDVNLINAGGNFQIGLSENATTNISFSTIHTQLQSDSGAAILNKTNNALYEVEGELLTQLWGMQFGVFGNLLYESLKHRQASGHAEATFGEVGIESLFPISGALSAELGVKYQTVWNEINNSSDLIAPYGRINFTPGNNIGFSAAIHTGYEYPAFSHHWKENPYIAHATPLLPNEIEWGAELYADVQIAPGFLVHGGIYHSRNTSLQYWQRVDSTGFFNRMAAKDVRLTELQAGIDWQLGEFINLRGSLETYTAQYPSDSPFAGVYYIPYRPWVRLPMQATITLPSEFELTVDGLISEKRNVDFNSLMQLPRYGLLSATISRTFGENYTVSLTGRNLLNTNYEIWEQYTEPGIQIFLGFRAKF